MKIRQSILLLALTCGGLRADPPAVAAQPQGIIILKAIAGYPAADAWFVSIQWVDDTNGYVIDKAGNRLRFVNDAIGRILYFDKNYYEEVNHNPYWLDWRAGLQSREAVIQPIPSGILDPGDAKRLADEQAVLQDAIDHYSNGADIVQPLIDTLKDESSKLASGLVFQNGAWISQKDAGAAPTSVPVVGESTDVVTFTTKGGKRFENAKVTATDTGLSMLTSDGGASVSYDQLPDDISRFPKTVQKKIGDWRAKNSEAVAAVSTPNSSGWWAWISSTWQYLADKVEAYFAPAKPAAAPAGSS